MTVAIGIDLGGSNLRGALYRFAGQEYQSLASHREEVSEPRDPDVIVERLAGLVARLSEAAGESGPIPLGIGFAGMLRGTDGVVANSPYMRWRDVPLGELLRKKLPRRSIVVENDVNAIAYGEYRVGAAVGGSSVLAVYLGTGVGGGLVIDGKPVTSASNCAGEIGHMKVVLDDSARPCACGSVGCVEAYVGGDNLALRARAELKKKQSLAVELAGSVEAVHAGHLEEAAARGDEYAMALWAEVGPLLGVTIANAVTLLNPSHLVLGGGVLSRTPVLKTYVTTAFQVAVNPPAGEAVAVVDAMLGDDAGLIGSALLALQNRHS